MKIFYFCVFLLIFLENDVFNHVIYAQTKKVFIHDIVRISCVCKDGEIQQNTGAGACSGHGGVLYWVYVEQPIHGIFQGNLPAIPNEKRILLTPIEIEELIRTGVELILPHIPKIPHDNPIPKTGKRKKTKKSPKNDIDEEQAEETREKNANNKQKDCDCNSVFSNIWTYFVIIFAQLLMFVLMYLIIKKTIHH